MRKLLSTIAALLAVSCAPAPVLAADSVPCDKQAHYAMLTLDPDVTPEAWASWVRRQQFSAEQLQELVVLDEVFALVQKDGPLSRDAQMILVRSVYVACLREGSI